MTYAALRSSHLALIGHGRERRRRFSLSVSVAHSLVCLFCILPQRSTVLGFSQLQQTTRQSSLVPLFVATSSWSQQQQSSQEYSSSQEQANANANDPHNAQHSTHSPSSSSSSQSLYEILGVSSTATRSELKASYVQLARQFHPDSDPGSITDTSDQFSEVATAYKLLSDTTQRRVYDRSLAAARLSERIAAAVTASEVPEMSARVLEKFALPLLRRTTATTLAGITAVTSQKSSSNTTQSWWKTAVSAVSAASQSIDCMELLEDAEKLEDQAVQRYKEAVALQQELSNSAVNRLHMTLHTVESGLTAAEAELLVEHYDLTLSPLFEVIPKQVETLHKRETAFLDQQHADQDLQERLQASVREKINSESHLTRAELAEQEAWAAYQRAKKEAMDAKQRLSFASSAVLGAERAAEDSAWEMERLSLATAAQSEIVRKSLIKKSRTAFSATNDINNESNPDEDDAQRRQKLDALRSHERVLHADAAKIELDAAKLLSQSNKLKRRAELLEMRRGTVAKEH